MKVTLDIATSDLEKLFNSIIAEPRIHLSNMTWEEYENLVQMFNHKPLVRLSYLEGNLEIMTNSPEDEMIKTLIGRLIEIYALEKEIDLYGCGSATYKKEAFLKYYFGKGVNLPFIS
ncbi:hypothetical protein VB715_07995 [Crocosphaera sp. UHCC 0190]|uniref:hypothetical protein n=1 Tax=Crocosphaera sp. UHCC 0190 TaxID=3110246 RepID=UPI002B1FCDC2|nr:hypothetical protein [Crocosphaera sp. UHCC 0190]MEA5509703.1 hypothetical protein [Crocosphaera sp. UHCC 0190]